MDLYPNKVVVGLTGGIASGKTTVSGLFEEQGWNAISTDKLVSDILKNDEFVIDAVKNRWEFKQGNIDKQKIAQIVFNNPAERSWLEDMLHPIVRKKWVSLIQQSSVYYHVVELPLLFEKKLSSYFSKTLSVFAPVKNQISRLTNRGLSVADASSRLSSQIPNQEKANLADFVILGNGSKEFLEIQVLSFIQKFKS